GPAGAGGPSASRGRGAAAGANPGAYTPLLLPWSSVPFSDRRKEVKNDSLRMDTFPRLLCFRNPQLTSHYHGLCWKCNNGKQNREIPETDRAAWFSVPETSPPGATFPARRRNRKATV